MGLLANDLTDILASSGSEMSPALFDTVTITRANKTQDAMGGTVYDFGTSNATTIVSGLAANLQNVSPREITDFARRGIKVSNKIFVSTEVATILGDRCTMGTDPSTYYVVTFISDMAGAGQAFKIYVDLVK